MASGQGSTVDALELLGEEGRGKLRKAASRSKHPDIRGWPNGVTRRAVKRSTSRPVGVARRNRGN